MRKQLLRERIFFYILLLVLIFLSLIMVWPYLNAILLAIAVVVIMYPVYRWLLKRGWIKGRENWATAATIIIFVLVIAIPTWLLFSAAFTQASELFEDLSDEDVNSIVADIEELVQGIAGEDVQIDEEQAATTVQSAIKAIVGWFVEVLISIGASLPQFFTMAIIVLVIMAVLLPRYKRPGRQDMMDIVPFPREITQLYLDKIDLMIVAMFKGIFVLAIIQGLAMGVVFWIAGVPYVPLLTLLSIIFSVIPFSGISWVAWPVAIALILTGNVVEGIFVIVSFLVIVANIDTVLRPRMVPKGAYLNPVLVILSVFGGIQLLGFIGIIYGPVIMILLVTSIDVYTKYVLPSDLEMLIQEGELDLEALGLAVEEDEEQPAESGPTTRIVGRLINRFRRGQEGDEPEPQETG